MNTSNEDPKFEQRLILAFALSVLVFLVALPLMNRKPAGVTPPTAPPRATAATTPGTSGTTPALAPPAAPEAKTPATAVKPMAATAPISANAAGNVVVDTPVYHVVLSNQGAVARTWVLTQYTDDNGHPLNLVDAAFAGKHGYPLAFWGDDVTLRNRLAGSLFKVDRQTGADGAQTVAFTWSDGHWTATKRLRFDASYVVQVHTDLTHDGQPVAESIAWPGAFGDTAAAGDVAAEQLVLQQGTQLNTQAVKKVTNGARHEAAYHAVGVEDTFFAAIFFPPDDATVAVTDLRAPTASNGDTAGFAVTAGTVNDMRLFIGPKKVDLIKSVDPQLSRLVDFGWFSFIAYPLFVWMNWTYIHWIHNYGWDILFLSFVLTMSMLPFRFKAQKSQAKMAALQPQVNALNARMKKYGMRDPRRQEIQQEVMKIYSDNGVNPLGGCLPMILPFPLIIAFYRVLQYAIELRHAPWIWYWHDLSAKDPYYVLPLLLIVSSFLTMQLMPPTPGQDPKQAMLMKWMMPLFMGWFFFYLPSGVNLYYLANNMLSAGQQVLVNKKYMPAPPASKGKKVIEGKLAAGKKK